VAEKLKAGCARPTGWFVGQPDTMQEQQASQPQKEVKKMIQVGKSAPDFVAPA
jgi:peroxiredoxin (alkyl hydroperoxide reductase subunit C)